MASLVPADDLPQNLVPASDMPDSGGSSSPTFPIKMGRDALAGDIASEAANTNPVTAAIIQAGLTADKYVRGAKQALGFGDAERSTNQDLLDAGLAATHPIAHTVGDIGGQIGVAYLGGKLIPTPAMTAPTSKIAQAALPYAKNAVIGAALGAGQVGTPEERLQRGAWGAAGGVAGTAAGQLVGAGADAYLANRASKLASQATRNAPIDATNQAAIDLGYQVPAATMAPGPVNTAIESIAGKKVIEHTASVNNAIKGDAAMLQDLNLPPQSIWSKGASGNPHPNGEATLDIAAKPYNQVYEDLKQAGPFRVDSQYTQNDLSPPISQGKVLSTTENPPGVLPKYSKTEIKPTINGEDAIESIKSLRAKSGMLFKKAATTNDPADLDAARSTLDAANDLEGLIERNLTTNNSGLLDQFQNARAMLAKINVAKDALVEGGGTFNQKVLGKIAEAKPGYLTGNMAIMGNFANNHPQLVTPMKQIGSPGVHGLSGKLSIGAKALSAIGGFAAGGLPGAAAGVTGEMAVEAAMGSMAKRAAMRTITPSYTPGMVPNALPYLAKALPLTGAVIGANQP